MDAVGGRYLRITLPDGDYGANNEKKVRIRVRPDCPGSTWIYVGPPELNRRNNGGRAVLVDSVSQAGEAISGGPSGYGGWGPVVYVTGGDIVAERNYVVEVEHRLSGVTVATQSARTGISLGLPLVIGGRRGVGRHEWKRSRPPGDGSLSGFCQPRAAACRRRGPESVATRGASDESTGRFWR